MDAAPSSNMQIVLKSDYISRSFGHYFLSQLRQNSLATKGEGPRHFQILNERAHKQSVLGTTLHSFKSLVGKFQEHCGDWGVRHL